MPLPISRSALDRLGKRLCAEVVSADDWSTFETVLDAYQATLDDAQSILEAAGFEPTTRVKSTGTLVEKLRRGTSFKSVQDVAGARVVLNGGRVDQDRAVARIVRAFAAASSAVKVLDRRTSPNHGSRAVHLIVTHQGLPLEVQVPTPLQDLWAQITERLGDLWGRELRYGQPLVPANQPVVPGMPPPVFTRENFVDMLLATSEEIDRVEQAQVRRYQEQDEIVIKVTEQTGVAPPLDETEDTLRRTMEAIMGLVRKLEGG